PGNVQTLRPRPGGDETVPRDDVATMTLHRAALPQSGGMGNEADAQLVQLAAKAFARTRDVGLAAFHEACPVESAHAGVEPHVASQRDALGRLGGQPHGFFRHTADVDAGATEEPRLEDDDAGAVAGGALGRREAAGAGTQHGQVVVVISHDTRSPETMVSAHARIATRMRRRSRAIERSSDPATVAARTWRP